MNEFGYILKTGTGKDASIGSESGCVICPENAPGHSFVLLLAAQITWLGEGFAQTQYEGDWNTKLQNYKTTNDLIGLEGGCPKPMRGEPEAGPIEASRSVLVVKRVGFIKSMGLLWMWCGKYPVSADNKKGWLCDQRVVKVVSVARQLSSKMIKTMMDSTVWTWMPGNRRTWLHLTSPYGGRCRGQCRKDSTP